MFFLITLTNGLCTEKTGRIEWGNSSWTVTKRYSHQYESANKSAGQYWSSRYEFSSGCDSVVFVLSPGVYLAARRSSLAFRVGSHLVRTSRNRSMQARASVTEQCSCFWMVRPENEPSSIVWNVHTKVLIFKLPSSICMGCVFFVILGCLLSFLRLVFFLSFSLSALLSGPFLKHFFLHSVKS